MKRLLFLLSMVWSLAAAAQSSKVRYILLDDSTVPLLVAIRAAVLLDSSHCDSIVIFGGQTTWKESCLYDYRFPDSVLGRRVFWIQMDNTAQMWIELRSCLGTYVFIPSGEKSTAHGPVNVEIERYLFRQAEDPATHYLGVVVKHCLDINGYKDFERRICVADSRAFQSFDF